MARRSDEALSDYTRKQGGAALGARLRRLSERIDRDATRAYAHLGLDFEQRWFGVLNLLSLHGPLSVGDLAAPLGISHVSVSQTRDSLQSRGLITSRPNRQDGRSRDLELTAAGRRRVAQFAPLWAALNAAASELNDEAGDAVAALERLDLALERSSLLERILLHLDRTAKKKTRRRSR